MFKIVLAGLLGLLLVDRPSITTSNDGERFKVSFEAGAIWACTIFQQQVVTEITENFPDGLYTPKHCWHLDPSLTTYDDNWAYIHQYDTPWKVWAELTYVENGETVIHKSNVIDLNR